MALRNRDVVEVVRSRLPTLLVQVSESTVANSDGDNWHTVDNLAV